MDAQVCHIDKLPDHLLVQIFGNLTDLPYMPNPFPGDFSSFSSPRPSLLLKRVGLVSRRWNKLALSPQLWRSFETPQHNGFCYDCPHSIFNRDRHDSTRILGMTTSYAFLPEFSSFLERIAPAIESLYIPEGTQLTGVFSQFPPLPNLKRLWVRPSLTPADADWMVTKCPNVTSVHFNFFSLDYIQLQLFACGWRNLVELKISGPNVTPAELIEFNSAAANPLQSIHMEQMFDLTDSDIDEITSAMSSSLKSISLGFDQHWLSGLAIRAISRNCPQLEEICVRKAMYIGDLRNLTNLRKLIINKVAGDFGLFEGFADCFCRPFNHLRYLKIADVSNLNDSILNLIANSCPSLETLILMSYGNHNSEVTDAGLSEIFSKCRRLTVLTIGGFPSLTGRSFVGGRETLPNLRVFNCHQPNLWNVLRTFAGAKGLQIYSGHAKILNV